jgi:hypothetical protein
MAVEHIFECDKCGHKARYCEFTRNKDGYIVRGWECQQCGCKSVPRPAEEDEKTAS